MIEEVSASLKLPQLHADANGTLDDSDLFQKASAKSLSVCDYDHGITCVLGPQELD